MHHLQLEGLTSWGASLLRALLLLLPLGGDSYFPSPYFRRGGGSSPGGDSYCPLVDREGVGDVDDLAVRRLLALQLACLLVGRSLRGDRSVELPLPDVAPMALSTLLVLYPSFAISCSLSVTMFAMSVGAGAVVLSRCSSAAAKSTMMTLIDAPSCLWS